MRFRASVCAVALSALALASHSKLSAQAPAGPDWTRMEGETLRHFQALLRLDTSNPPGNEYLVTDYVKVGAREGGHSGRDLRVRSEAAQPVARLKGSGRKQPILFMGHSDVVTVDPKKWTFPPFSATRDGGYIYGRGSLDDKPHVVAGLMTLLTLKRLNVPLDRDVIFLVESGEEGTSGSASASSPRSMRMRSHAEYCLAEGGNVTRLGGGCATQRSQAGEKLPRAIELVATGPRAMPRVPLQGNAVVHLAAAVAAAGKWRVPVRLNDTTRAFFTKMAEVSPPADAARYRAILDPTSPAGIAADDYFAANEPSTRRCFAHRSRRRSSTAGTASNVIPSEAKATLDVRMLPDEDPQQFLEALTRVINDPPSRSRSRRRPAHIRPAGRAGAADSEAFRVIQSAAARNYDTVTIPMMGTGATDMAQVRAKGTECYGVGPASDFEDAAKGFGAHSDQERILEAELHRFVQFSYEVVYDLARRN